MDGAVRRKPPEEGESYFMSMTDMMVGLLLIFIILLAYFALNLQSKTEELTGANRTREVILNGLKQALKNKGLQVEIDTKTGVLRLPDDVLFEKGSWDLTDSGQAAISKVASAMVEVLPCYTTSNRCKGTRSPHLIDAVFVEGHTDSDAMYGEMNNYGLSARRAEITFTMLQRNQAALREFLNKPPGEPGSAPILGLSGYGPDRPIADGDSEAAKKRNRRIDLRFLMTTPNAGMDKDILRRRQ
ncbi:OmpA/MotB family protein [Polymorphobacter fuscus]|uniref:OmpA family protein n=1 Tax=Sandarakinorhabdus fusca TaxID=1439888 RepID=A0A7C9GQ35_9SPHN|nr:OmpA family protein [Polymorphobacter fuscus]KAB7646118.1 OmpA family protein [Polymorphobacter fuscus]MQT17316.1 OmpA family protein [Polymorphobacter fuscus]NJC10151.1 outer membrane protein OmpA-like peptidoglycan-associated protein [Polymorphobacter fuscus]